MSKNLTELFVKAPLEMILNAKGKVNATEVLIYLVIRSHKNETRDEPVFPSRKRIASLVGCHITTVSRGIKRLERAGFLSHIQGRSGLSNKYTFIDPSYQHRSTHAPMMGASTHLLVCNDASTIEAYMQHQLDPYNKNHQLEIKPRLYHGQDICSVKEDGVIEIKNHSGQWVKYSGGDDQRFRFGKLEGIAAKKAAIEYFKEKPRKTSEKHLGLSEDKQD